MLKYLISALLLFFSLSVQAQQEQFQNIALSQFKTGERISYAMLDNTKPTYFKLWASWCKPCMAQMPHFAELHREFADKVNFVAVNININENRTHIQQVIEKYHLQMPIWLDNNGQLAQALGLVGTPYSVLINADGNIVYTTHESDANLARFLDMLKNGQKLENVETKAMTEQQKQALLDPFATGEHVLFFTATWCDWYLKDSRPDMAQTCQQVQSELNNLQAQVADKKWLGVVNHLWTDEKALADFKNMYDLHMPFRIDDGGVLFTAFNIRHIPTIVYLKDGKVQTRITDFSDKPAVIKQLSKHSFLYFIDNQMALYQDLNDHLNNVAQ